MAFWLEELMVDDKELRDDDGVSDRGSSCELWDDCSAGDRMKYDCDRLPVLELGSGNL